MPAGQLQPRHDVGRRLHQPAAPPRLVRAPRPRRGPSARGTSRHPRGPRRRGSRPAAASRARSNDSRRSYTATRLPRCARATCAAPRARIHSSRRRPSAARLCSCSRAPVTAAWSAGERRRGAVRPTATRSAAGSSRARLRRRCPIGRALANRRHQLGRELRQRVERRQTHGGVTPLVERRRGDRPRAPACRLSRVSHPRSTRDGRQRHVGIGVAAAPCGPAR